MAKELNQIEKGRAESIKAICIGIVAKNMGYAQGSKVIKSGEEIFKYIAEISHQDFKLLKRLKKCTKILKV